MNLQFKPQTQRTQTVPAKAFPLQMRGRGLEAPARPNTLNICMVIVFCCLGHCERGHRQVFKIPPSPSNGPSHIHQKYRDALHHLSSLSLCPSTVTCLFSSYLTRNSVRKSLMEEAQSLEGKKEGFVVLHY